MMACDWSNYDEELFQQFDFLRNNFEVSHPFGFQAICESEQMLQSCATIYSSKNFPDKSHFFLHHFKKITSSVKVGFLCGEFRDHATSHLMIRVWELFNLERFDIFAFDSGWNDSSKYRQRIQKAFGNNFFNIRNQSDEDAASLIHNLNINILINLNGFFGESRQGIFSYKPAPIQVNYLGFPGTIGAPYIDYLIADSTVIPNSSRQFYTEKVVYLPNCYQANDNLRPIICNPPYRSDYGLPENAFVFACFNNNYKITPKFFSLWIDILKNVPHSVLWLIFDNADAKMNLLRFAELSGINKERIIFSERVDLSQHLSRHILADLFLDTLPYNAHTTASDALWAGLPIVTMTGNSFPGRVATSLLYSIGLPELVAKSEDEYKQIAINLAISKNELATLKNKLKINRNNSILFDSKLFTVNFENALLGMVDRYNKNLPPDHISF